MMRPFFTHNKLGRAKNCRFLCRRIHELAVNIVFCPRNDSLSRSQQRYNHNLAKSLRFPYCPRSKQLYNYKFQQKACRYMS